MEVQVLKVELERFRPHIVVSKREIDRNSPEVVEFIELYYKLTGKRVGEGKCRNCILDAYMELSLKNEKQLKRLLMPSKFKLKEGRVVVFNNTDYTNANMTDDVAMKMIEFSAKHAGNFVNPKEVMDAFREKNPVGEQEALPMPPQPDEDVEKTPEKDEETLSLEELKAKYKDVKGRKPHWKWDYDRILEKLNED